MKTGGFGLFAEKRTKYSLEESHSCQSWIITYSIGIFSFWPPAAARWTASVCSLVALTVRPTWRSCSWSPLFEIHWPICSLAPLFDSANKLSHWTRICRLQHHLPANFTILKVAVQGWGRGSCGVVGICLTSQWAQQAPAIMHWKPLFVSFTSTTITSHFTIFIF